MYTDNYCVPFHRERNSNTKHIQSINSFMQMIIFTMMGVEYQIYSYDDLLSSAWVDILLGYESTEVESN